MDIHWLLFGIKRVKLSVHAIKRARKRLIFPSMIEATIKAGKVKRFGKHYIKIWKRYKKGIVICIGEDLGEFILIKTIEWCKRK